MRAFLASVHSKHLEVSEVLPINQNFFTDEDVGVRTLQDSLDDGDAAVCTVNAPIKPHAVAYRHRGKKCPSPDLRYVLPEEIPDHHLVSFWASKARHEGARDILRHHQNSHNVLLVAEGHIDPLHCTFHRTFPWVVYCLNSLSYLWAVAPSGAFTPPLYPQEVKSPGDSRVHGAALLKLRLPNATREGMMTEGSALEKVTYPWGSSSQSSKSSVLSDRYDFCGSQVDSSRASSEVSCKIATPQGSMPEAESDRPDHLRQGCLWILQAPAKILARARQS